MSSQSPQTSIPQRSLDAYIEAPRVVFLAGSVLGAAAAFLLILLLVVL